MTPPPDGVERRSGCDRRGWDGVERRHGTGLSAQGPGGFKLDVRGGGLLLGYLLGVASVAAAWLWTLLRAVK